MMKAAYLRESDNVARTRRTGRARLRTVFGERQMGPGSMVVVDVGRQDPLQVMRVQDNNVIEAFPPDRPDDALDIGILPGLSH